MTLAQRFNASIRAAQLWLVAGELTQALVALRLALKSANALSREHRSVTLRAMNWVRAARRRAAFS